MLLAIIRLFFLFLLNLIGCAWVCIWILDAASAPHASGACVYLHGTGGVEDVSSLER